MAEAPSLPREIAGEPLEGQLPQHNPWPAASHQTDGSARAPWHGLPNSGGVLRQLPWEPHTAAKGWHRSMLASSGRVPSPLVTEPGTCCKMA